MKWTVKNIMYKPFANKGQELIQVISFVIHPQFIGRGRKTYCKRGINRLWYK
jgi:hypothetical protein